MTPAPAKQPQNPPEPSSLLPSSCFASYRGRRGVSTGKSQIPVPPRSALALLPATTRLVTTHCPAGSPRAGPTRPADGLTPAALLGPGCRVAGGAPSSWGQVADTGAEAVLGKGKAGSPNSRPEERGMTRAGWLAGWRLAEPEIMRRLAAQLGRRRLASSSCA